MYEKAKYATLIVICLVAFYYYYHDELTKSHVCNNVDNRCYAVVNTYDETERAAEILGQLNLFCVRVMKHLRNKYVWSNNTNTRARDLVEFLLSNYNQDGIIENAPTSDVNTSYVDEKGKIFAICLREKLSGRNHFHDLHDLQFVVLHEMAHMSTYSYGHDRSFWVNFKFLLQEAEAANLHHPINYRKTPINYCSLRVDYNPYYDDNLENIA